MLNPDAREAYAEEIRRVYEDAERRLVEKVTKRLNKGLENPGWVESMLAEVRQVNKELAGEVGTLKTLDPRIEAILTEVYDGSAELAAVELGSNLTVKAIGSEAEALDVSLEVSRWSETTVRAASGRDIALRAAEYNSDTWTLVVRNEAGDIVGVLLAKPLPGVLDVRWVGTLVNTPGAGRRLMNEVFRRAQAEGSRVRVASVLNAEGFYEHIGMTPTGGGWFEWRSGQPTPFNLGMLDVDLTTIRGAAIRRLVAATVNALDSTHFRILRDTQDAYRSVIAQVVEQMAAGGLTPRETAQAALNRWADQGITGFTDKAGRRWEMSSYADMAIRSAMAQAAVAGHLDILEANGEDLVICSDSPEECELCRPFEGKVLSISGQAGYTSVLQAVEAGLFHPNCTHNLYIYIEGVTRPMVDTANPEGYADRQEQRAIERQIRHWKRRLGAAITDVDRRFSTVKVREWQARMRAFIERTGRLRQSDREQVRVGVVGGVT